MSYIFEALQRAEGERTGTNEPLNADSLVELLQRTEQRAAEIAEAQSTKAKQGKEVLEVPGATLIVGGEFAETRVLKPTLPVDARLVCLTDQGSLAAENFRVLGLKLRNLREQRKLKRVVVTGTAPEEGKSLVAANLAINQGRSKVYKTLLLDGDLRRPTLAQRFGFDRSLPGLSEYLRGELALSDAVYKVGGSNLWLLPAGHVPRNPLEAMQSGRVPELLDQLGKFFDWIIIDTPPVVPVADTGFWMKLADGVLMVIREGVSEKRTIEKALDSFERSALLGVVVNSCSSSDHRYYYTRYTQPASQGVAGLGDQAGRD